MMLPDRPVHNSSSLHANLVPRVGLPIRMRLGIAVVVMQQLLAARNCRLALAVLDTQRVSQSCSRLATACHLYGHES